MVPEAHSLFAARLAELNGFDAILELKEQGQFQRRDDRRLSPETAAKVMRTGEYQRLAEQWTTLCG